MATGGSGVHIWSVPGNVAEEFPSRTGNVTIQCKFGASGYFILSFHAMVDTQ